MPPFLFVTNGKFSKDNTPRKIGFKLIFIQTDGDNTPSDAIF